MNNNCPICDLGLSTSQKEIEQGYEIYKCDNCGNFEIVPSSLHNYQEKKHYLAGYLFGRENNGRIVEINSSTIEKLIDTAEIQLSPLDKIDKLLLYINEKSKYFSEEVAIEYEKYPLCYAYNIEEFRNIIENAEKMNYIEAKVVDQYYLTLEGYERIQTIQANESLISNTAFVAMWFDSNMDDIYLKGIKNALEETGYIPTRIDEINHNEKIDNRIMAEIRRSSLVIADFTGQRGGVYFEAGFAIGLNIPVIWTCKKDEVEKLHFDTRQYNHILWEDEEDLKKQIVNRIEGTGLSRSK